MKTKLILTSIIIISLLFQSCSTYKYTGANEMKTGKNYIVKLKSGKIIDAKFVKILDNEILLIVNENTVKFPKSEIEYIKKEQLSVLRLLGGGVLATAGIIILLNDAKAKKDELFLEPFN